MLLQTFVAQTVNNLFRVVVRTSEDNLLDLWSGSSSSVPRKNKLAVDDSKSDAGFGSTKKGNPPLGVRGGGASGTSTAVSQVIDKGEQICLSARQSKARLESDDGVHTVLAKFLDGLQDKIKKQLGPKPLEVMTRGWEHGQPPTPGVQIMQSLQEWERRLPNMVLFSTTFLGKSQLPSALLQAILACEADGINLSLKAPAEYVKRCVCFAVGEYDWVGAVQTMADDSSQMVIYKERVATRLEAGLNIRSFVGWPGAPCSSSSWSWGWLDEVSSSWGWLDRNS